MPASGHQQEDHEPALKERAPEDDLTAAANGAPDEDRALDDATVSPDANAPQAGAVEIDERRAKMERLRAEGIDPYPPVTLWETRTRIADVLAAHDPSQLEHGEHPELRYQIAGRLISRRG